MSVTTFNHTSRGWMWMGGGTTWADGRSRSSAGIMSQSEIYIKMARGSGDNTDRGRGFVVFNTSGLPDNATISAAIFRAKCESVFSNDFGGGMTIVPGTTANDTYLVDTDYNISNFGSSLGSKALSAMSAGVDFDINLSSFSSINKSGYTKIGVLETHDYDNDNSAGDGTIETRLQDTGSIRLIVTWTTPPATSTGGSSNIQGTTADLVCQATDAGGGTISASGIVLSSSNGTPTLADTVFDDGAHDLSSHTIGITGLSANTTYYYRSFVTTENSTQYGSVQSFLTDTTPAVSSTSVTNISPIKAIGSGNVTSDGRGTVSERGFVLGTTINPTTANTKFASGSGTGAFTVDLTGLVPGKSYHVRAYAINGVGTVYGADIAFTTPSAAIIFLGGM